MYEYIDTIIPTFNTIIVFTVGIKLHITVFYHRFVSYTYLYFIVFCGFCVVWDILVVILYNFFLLNTSKHW